MKQAEERQASGLEGVTFCVAAGLAEAIEGHLAVCNELLALAHKESDGLRSGSGFLAAEVQAERKALLRRLESALNGLVQKRSLWQQPGMEGVARDPRVARSLQTALDTIMRVLVLDRENEQHLLRRGMLPARSLPAAESSHPHYVADLYQRHAQGRTA